jgi:uncharacterized protein (DUF934 family)
MATNLKARPKATPDRISQNIETKQVIREQQVQDNDWLHLAESEELSIDSVTAQSKNVSVPLSFWLENKDALSSTVTNIAVQIAADEFPEDLAEDLAKVAVVVLPFVSYVDGRSYSHAYKLRTQYNFAGEIRATGDVHFDQLDFLNRVGVNAFELPDEEDSQAALAALSEFSQVYQPSADAGRLIFSRRRATH